MMGERIVVLDQTDIDNLVYVLREEINACNNDEEVKEVYEDIIAKLRGGK